MSTDRLILEFLTRGAPEMREELRAVAADTEKTGKQALYAGRRWEHASGMMSRGIKGLAGLVGIQGVAFGIKDVVEAGMHLQEQQTMLRNALKGVGETGSEAFNKINDAAVKSAESGGFSRDEELQSITQFVRSTHSSTEALEANRAAVNLARDDGISYTSAQHYLAQAVVGNFNRLKQYTGYIVPVTTAQQKLTDATKAQVDAWDLQAQQMNKASAGSGTAWLRQQELAHGATRAMQQQALMQDKLATGREVLNRLLSNKRFDSGQQAYNKTFEGQVTDLKATFEEVEGAIGITLIPMMMHVVKAGLDVIKFFDKCKILAALLAGAVTTLGAIAFGRTLYGGLMFALNPLNKLWKMLTVVNETTKLTAVQSSIMTARLKLMAAQEWLTETATTAWATATGALNTLLEVTGIRAAATAVKTGVLAAAQWVQTAATGALDIATGILTGEISALDVAMGILLAPITLIIVGILALAAAIYFGIKYHRQLGEVAVAVWHGIESAAKSVWGWMKTAATDIAHFFVSAFHEIERIATSVFDWILGKIKTVMHFVSGIGNFFGGGIKSIGSFFGGLSTGGVVTAHHYPVKHLYTGGPAGTDTVEGWLTPGEDVLSRAGAATLNGMIGQSGLTLLNAGGNPFNSMGGGSFQIQPGTVYVQIDGRTIARAVVQYTLKKAARGPSSLSGGSLVTGT